MNAKTAVDRVSKWLAFLCLVLSIACQNSVSGPLAAQRSAPSLQAETVSVPRTAPDHPVPSTVAANAAGASNVVEKVSASTVPSNAPALTVPNFGAMASPTQTVTSVPSLHPSATPKGTPTPLTTPTPSPPPTIALGLPTAIAPTATPVPRPTFTTLPDYSALTFAEGATPLHEVALYGEFSRFAIIISMSSYEDVDLKADVVLADGRRVCCWTPLHAAALNPNPRIIAELLERGATVDSVNGDGLTACQLTDGKLVGAAVHGVLCPGWVAESAELPAPTSTVNQPTPTRTEPQVIQGKHGPIIASQAWYVDGLTRGELSRANLLEGALKEHPSLVGDILSIPWVSDGITTNAESTAEGFALQEFSRLLKVDPVIAENIARAPWFSDGNISYEDVDTLTTISLLSVENLSMVQSFLDAPLFDGPLEGLRFHAVASLRTLIRSGQWEQVSRAPWFQDGLQEDDYILITAAAHVHRNEAVFREITSANPISSIIKMEDDYTLPLGGKVKLFAVSGNPMWRDEAFEHNRVAVMAIEKFIGEPFPKAYAGVFVDPGFSPVYRTAFLKVPSPSPRIIYHEVGHTYFSNLRYPKWVSEGIATFFAFYLSSGGNIRAGDSAYYPRCSAQLGINTVQASIDYRDRLFAAKGSVLPNEDCAYSTGVAFFSGMYLSLGRDAVSAQMRELFRMGKAKVDEATGRPIRLTEQEIYEVMLSNTPLEKQEEFRRQYRALHGGPVPEP